MIRTSEDRYRMLLASMESGFALLDVLESDGKGGGRDYRFVESNRAFEAIAGASAGGLAGRTVREVWPAVDPVLIEPLDHAAKTGQPVRLQGLSQVLGKYVSLSAFIPWPGQIALMAQDITSSTLRAEEQWRIEEQMRNSQKLQSLGVLASGIAQDFNNLLVGMMGFAELAAKTLPEGSPAVAHLEDIRRAGERAADLAALMLAYAGRRHAERRILDLNRLVRESIDLLKPSWPKISKVELALDDKLAPLKGDAAQIEQVVMNLLLNAAESTAGHPGVVRVETTSVSMEGSGGLEGGWVLGAVMAPGLYARFTVRDSGCGMSEDTQRYIFDPFFTTKMTGRGLGLSAVLGILRAHNGNVKVESREGEGTVFTVLLPMFGEAVRPPAPTAHMASSVKALKGTVLVADDESCVRRVIQAGLKAYGGTAILVEDGASAIAEIEAHGDEIDLALMDVSMSGMETAGTVQRLRKIKPELPILLMSGSDEEEAMRKFGGEGIRRFVQKPFTIKGLVEIVAQALETEGK